MEVGFYHHHVNCFSDLLIVVGPEDVILEMNTACKRFFALAEPSAAPAIAHELTVEPTIEPNLKPVIGLNDQLAQPASVTASPTKPSTFEHESFAEFCQHHQLAVTQQVAAAWCGEQAIPPYYHNRKGAGVVRWHVMPFSLGEKRGLIESVVLVGNRLWSEVEVGPNSSVFAMPFEQIMQILPGHIYWKDQFGVYLGCNRIQAKDAGFSHTAEIIGKTDVDLHSAKEAEQLLAIDQQVMREDCVVCFEEHASFQVEGHESQRVFLSHKKPLHNEDGDVVGVLGISVDITERKKIELSLGRFPTIQAGEAYAKRAYIACLAEQMAELNVEPELPPYVHVPLLSDCLAQIISFMPGDLYWYDRQHRFLGCNENFLAVAGFSSCEEVLGKTDAEMPWGAFSNNLNKVNERVMATGTAVVIEELGNVYESGGQLTTRVFLTQKVPLRDSKGDIVGVLALSFDITEQRHRERKLAEAKERAEVANRAKTEFLANMSHELRTPLNAILGMAQILKLQLKEKEQAEYVDTIYSAGKSLTTLIEDILDFAKLEAGKLVIQDEAFDLATVVANVIDSLCFTAQDKGLSLSLVFPEACPRQLVGDPHRLQQILMNLVNNAIKFTEQGGVLIKVGLYKREAQQLWLEFRVEDTGIGIPTDQFDAVFSRFEQVVSSYQSQYKGAGLGLAISKQLTALMGGTISVESELGKGSAFCCQLPFSEQTEQDEDLAPKALSAGETGLRTTYGGTVLIIEDNYLNQQVLALMLAAHGCELLIASNGEQALDLLGAQRPDLICLDIGLPDINGLDLARQIKTKFQPRGGYLPIVAITAHVMQAEKKSCYDAGIDDILSKPVMHTALAEILDKWLKPDDGKKDLSAR